MAFYERLFYTVSLSLVNFLTVEKGFRIAKVKRDQKSSFIVFFYFEETPELLEAVEEFNRTHKPTQQEFIDERLNHLQDGLWVGEKWTK